MIRAHPFVVACILAACAPAEAPNTASLEASERLSANAASASVPQPSASVGASAGGPAPTQSSSASAEIPPGFVSTQIPPGVGGIDTTTASFSESATMSKNIKHGIRDKARSIRACYEAELRASPNLSTRVTVRFVIGTDGKVGNVQVDSRDAPISEAFGHCIANAFGEIEFPKPEAGVVQVSYPLVFQPE